MSHAQATPRASSAPHPFHLVDPSPWPLVGSISALVLVYGAVDWFRNHAHTTVMLIGLGLVGLTMFGWWRDIFREARSGQAHTLAVCHGLRLGMSLFIASEVMFFAAFFWAYFYSALGVAPMVSQWPPAGIKTLDTWHIPFINTLILMSSGVTLTKSHHALRHDHRGATKAWLALTIALGILFLSLQIHEYGQALFAFTDGIYPSVFYMATGFHGFHVFVGVCFLGVCLNRVRKGDFTPDKHVGFEAAAWYWHFVDVVWVFLFVWVYWWGNG
ncbi:Cytochrome c oxidase polypeptide III [Paramagnetospirillum magnetotacticum MS-1]|uniref:cytochrome-c oxidase n=1 Tax=Paramagnetospirillum magnetotacticum MS-1 TaxID=272627 RepID=A0A0C2YUE9_PARME|nr:cytochrome c oxidase subunit 3 [Paramagnetospirillum magnetotacticum]KIL98335.1 Cytochrome c oxidase polypeptide III [Paramagnetospirillum magnetotacticum MS-1]